MNHRQKINPVKYITVFSITTLIFIVGILIGNYFSSQKMQQIDYIGQKLKTDTTAMEIQYDLIADNPCQDLNATPLADQLYEMASKLDYMENRLGENNRDVLSLKEYYSLLELRHWLFIQKTNKECNKTSANILFFYTNEDDCSKCKEQGFILTWMRRNYKDVNIYSFDYTIENAALDTLKRLYDVEGAPAIIVNKKTYNKFVSKNELQNMLESQGIERITD